jgi:hypothetical protein
MTNIERFRATLGARPGRGPSKDVMSDRELEAFKREIDLREYAAKDGYELDKRESWHGSAVMRKGGDKVIIKRDGDGHYVYFSVRDERDNGSIIDFIQHRKGLNLGAVRKELRPWIGQSSQAGALPLFPTALPRTKDRMRVEAEYGRMREARQHRYLEKERGLPPAVLQSDRFAGRVRTDARGNAVFPHFMGSADTKSRIGVSQDLPLAAKRVCGSAMRGLTTSASCFAKARLML